MPIGHYRSDISGKFLSVSQGLATLLGYESPVELTATVSAIQRNFYADSALRAVLLDQLLSHGCIMNVAVDLRLKSGEIRVFREYARAIYDDSGSVVCFEGTFIDDTEYGCAESRALIHKQCFIELTADAQEGAFLAYGSQLHFMNSSLATILGYEAKSCPNVSVEEICESNDLLSYFQCTWQDKTEARGVQIYEVQLLQRSQKSSIPFLLFITTLLGSGGNPLHFAITRRLDSLSSRERRFLDVESAYQGLFDNAVVGMFKTTPAGRILNANIAYAKLLGYRTVHELIQDVPHIKQLYFTPDERARLLEEIRQTGVITNQEVALRSRDGKCIWVVLNSRAEYDGDGAIRCLLGSVTDVTERKAVELALVNSENRYRALVETTHIGVFLVKNNRIVYANRALAGMLGYSDGGLIGLSGKDIYSPESWAELESRQGQLDTAPSLPSVFEASMLTRDGINRIPVTVFVNNYEERGESFCAGTVLDITKQKQHEQQLSYNATHDDLTGLPNRRFIVDRLERIIARARHTGRHDYAILFMDLDGFKLVNDTYGHTCGDTLLVSIAKRLGDCLRPADIAARLGGDEFIILLDQVKSVHDAVTVARRFNEILVRPATVAEQEIYISASIGVAVGSEHYRSADEVIRDADTAMYSAKTTEKGSFMVFGEGMHKEVEERLALETELRNALIRNELTIYYQPVVDLLEERLIGFEALIRWDHPKRGLLSPAMFLGVADEIGILPKLDNWVMQTALSQLAKWRKRYAWARDITVSVNVANSQFVRKHFVEDVREALESSGLMPSALCLEITESVAIGDMKTGIARLSELKNLGVALHLDDFGSGLSSLAYLEGLPFDLFKLDRTFVTDPCKSGKRTGMLCAILQLANSLNMEVIAEGIETTGQMEILKSVGFRFGQGYLLGRPQQASDIERRDLMHWCDKKRSLQVVS